MARERLSINTSVTRPTMLAGVIEPINQSKNGVFQSVSRAGTEDDSTLLISGDVSRYQQDSAEARLWVGMGAGSSYFDALVEFHQVITGMLLGTIHVNKY